MARLWKRLTPSGKIKDQYDRINDNALYGEELEVRVDEQGEQIDNAVNLATDANEIASGVQEQLNTIVIDGDSSVEAAQARVSTPKGVTFDVLKDRLDAAEDDFLSKFASPEESSPLGDELASSSGWTSTGWTGDFDNGFEHTVGQTAPLTYEMPEATGTKLYQIAITVDSPTSSSAFAVTLGNSESFVVYRGASESFTYEWGIRSVSDGDFQIIPQSAFDGTITAISIRAITGTIAPSLPITDAESNNVFELRPTTQARKNTFLGIGAGRQNTSGEENVAVGVNALRGNTSGYWSIAIGVDALLNNTVGSRNVAIGRLSLLNNISGHRNISIGTFAMRDNTHGANNIALGADALWNNTTGYSNIALGLAAMSKNLTGFENIGIGVAALNGLQTGQGNICIGDYAGLLYNPSSPNQQMIAIGRDAARNTANGEQIAIGELALTANTTGVNNIVIGNEALEAATNSDSNIAIGHKVAEFATALSRCVIIGAGAGANLESGGNNNIIIGYSAGSTVTTGNNNIIIGYDAEPSSPTRTYQLNIGGVLYGNLASMQKQIGIDVTNPTARLHLPAGGTGAGSAPLKLTSGSLLSSVENGTFEYDGTNLYFTSGGTRKTISMS